MNKIPEIYKKSGFSKGHMQELRFTQTQRKIFLRPRRFRYLGTSQNLLTPLLCLWERSRKEGGISKSRILGHWMEKNPLEGNILWAL